MLREFGVAAGAAILDAACGVGTQTLGLARAGYAVTASDISPGAVARARREAEARELTVTFAVADLRELSSAFPSRFDAVLACDNAIPHLLSDAEILRAFSECRRCLVPGGVLLVSARDYARIERKTPDVRPYGARVEGDRRYSAEQIWTWDGDQYDLVLRLSEEEFGGVLRVREFRSRYYAVGLDRLAELMTEAGFSPVVRRDEHFFQPLLVGRAES